MPQVQEVQLSIVEYLGYVHLPQLLCYSERVMPISPRKFLESTELLLLLLHLELGLLHYSPRLQLHSSFLYVCVYVGEGL